MEPRFGHDFSRVRIHADDRAAESARAVGALAYTVGSHVAFDRGRYAPGSREGQELLAHELAHVVQQGSATLAPAASGLSISPVRDPLESQADSAAAAALRGMAPHPGRTEGPALQRSPSEEPIGRVRIPLEPAQPEGPKPPTAVKSDSQPEPQKPQSEARAWGGKADTEAGAKFILINEGVQREFGQSVEVNPPIHGFRRGPVGLFSGAGFGGKMGSSHELGANVHVLRATGENPRVEGGLEIDFATKVLIDGRSRLVPYLDVRLPITVRIYSFSLAEPSSGPVAKEPSSGPVANKPRRGHLAFGGKLELSTRWERKFIPTVKADAEIAVVFELPKGMEIAPKFLVKFQWEPGTNAGIFTGIGLNITLPPLSIPWLRRRK